MGSILHYSMLGTFIGTTILLGVTFIVILDIVDEINEFQSKVEEDLDQFKMECYPRCDLPLPEIGNARVTTNFNVCAQPAEFSVRIIHEVRSMSTFLVGGKQVDSRKIGTEHWPLKLNVQFYENSNEEYFVKVCLTTNIFLLQYFGFKFLISNITIYYRYKEGVVMDPAMFRWYSADMTQAEFFRFTPRSVFLYVGSVLVAFYIYTRLMFVSMVSSYDLIRIIDFPNLHVGVFVIMDIKHALKEAKQFLGAGKSELALGMLKVICVQAIRIDSSMPVAWQGLYKLYSGNKLVADDRALDVCDKIMEISDNDEKKIILMDLKRNILFELSRYDILKEDLGTNELLMARIINKLSGKEILSTMAYIYIYIYIHFFISHTFNDEWINFISSSITTHVDKEIRVEELIKYIRFGQLNFYVKKKVILMNSLFRILECLHTGSFLEGLTLGDELVAQPDSSWSDLLLVSEMQLAGGKDPVALLVKAAKINPRSSRIFFILGKALASKNPSKAKLFLERAVKIRPTNEEYVSELDDVLKLTGATVEQRLLILKKLAEKSKPLWLKKRLAGLVSTFMINLYKLFFSNFRLFMLIDDRNATINELQQVLRDEPEDITSWALLAEVYWKRGHLQASVNAYEKVLELDSKSDYVVCVSFHIMVMLMIIIIFGFKWFQLMQVLIRMHNTDAALERCRKWREIGRGNEDTAMAIHLRLVVLSHGINRFMHLRQLFQILAEVIEKKPRVSLAFKLAGDALLHVVKYKENVLNLLEKHPLYQDIFEKLVTPNAIGFKELYTTHYKSVNIPLIISAILRFKMPLLEVLRKLRGKLESCPT
uniref:NADH dehydrogenase [ubiquinone] 1 beta subcomplex subunit 4 n=1 Tax=Heterorhabditis bacteriophora TaxID=37862 RepID=A0A1I7WNH7_HETBA